MTTCEERLAQALTAYDQRGTELADKDRVIAGLREALSDKNGTLAHAEAFHSAAMENLARATAAEAAVTRLTSEAEEREKRIGEAIARARAETALYVNASNLLRTTEARVAALEEALRAWDDWWQKSYQSAKTIGGHPDHGIDAYEITAKQFEGHPQFARALLQPQEQTDAQP